MPTSALRIAITKTYSTILLLAVLAALSLPQSARAQGLELGGGWAHATGDDGTDGFNVGVAWWFTKRVTLAADYDSAWDTTSLTNFTFSHIGGIATKAHLQNALIGPRIFFSTNWTDKHKLNPFGEAQFGVSHLSETIAPANQPTVSASDTGFSWMLGGGAEYLLSPHWSGRLNLDLLRTHLGNEGESHLRLVLGIRYTIGSRGKSGH
jgi:opacity protein-like surface antigen